MGASGGIFIPKRTAHRPHSLDQQLQDQVANLRGREHPQHQRRQGNESGQTERDRIGRIEGNRPHPVEDVARVAKVRERRNLGYAERSLALGMLALNPFLVKEVVVKASSASSSPATVGGGTRVRPRRWRGREGCATKLRVLAD